MKKPKNTKPKLTLDITHPELAAQWHPTKNGDLKPSDVTYNSHKEVYWYLPYDDPKTGKHFNFEWSERISDIVHSKNKNPFLSNRRVWKGFNDLATTHPDIAAQWHPTKNGDLTPYDVTYGSDKEVYWFLPYDDPKTGKHFDFEWPDKIRERTIHNIGCPFLSNRRVWKGFNDLATTHPDIAAQWHPTKNGDLTPYDVTYGSDKKTYFICPFCGDTFHTRIVEFTLGKVKSCGCLSSKGNATINKYLQSFNFDYCSEYSFIDLRLIDLLRFDFAIFKHNRLQFLLEYHGEQHYKDTDFGRQQREITDPMKLEYCQKNNIKLHIIPYYEASTEEEIQARVREILIKENIITVSPIKDIIIRPAAVLSKPLSLATLKAI